MLRYGTFALPAAKAIRPHPIGQINQPQRRCDSRPMTAPPTPTDVVTYRSIHGLSTTSRRSASQPRSLAERTRSQRIRVYPRTSAVGVVQPPARLWWSGGSPTFDLTIRSERRRVYELVLQVGTTQDVEHLIDPDLLSQEWDTMIRPPQSSKPGKPGSTPTATVGETETTIVELTHDYRWLQPVETDVGLVLDMRELAADKCAHCSAALRFVT